MSKTTKVIEHLTRFVTNCFENRKLIVCRQFFFQILYLFLLYIAFSVFYLGRGFGGGGGGGGGDHVIFSLYDSIC